MAETKEKITSSEEDLIKLRRDKLAELEEIGLSPFDCNFPVKSTAGELANDFSTETQVSIAGRITSRRDMGKSQFFDLSDANGRIQCFLNKKNITEEQFYAFKNLIDLGDWLAVEGETFTTKVGEPTVRVENISIVSKALRPLPDKWHGLSDIERKYRQRYLDLISNQTSREVLKKRSQILSEIRNFFHEKKFMEVETPMLQDIAGGAAAKPFETHHNALNMPLFMRIAPELFLKRILVGGFPKIFELNRNFRNEGISRRHNPEFTMLEFYQSFANFETMADLVEELICQLAEKIAGSLKLPQYDSNGEIIREINLSRPWQRRKYQDLIKEIDSSWFNYNMEEKKQKCQQLKVEIQPDMAEHEITQQIFEKLIEEKTFDPLFVTDLPAELVPLAKTTKDNPNNVDVYELIINGLEISPGYSEQNNPDIQRNRFEEQVGNETQNIDEGFLLALEHGMPPAGGAGVGFDRLVMLLTGMPSIRDVIFFPQLKKIEK